MSRNDLSRPLEERCRLDSLKKITPRLLPASPLPMAGQTKPGSPLGPSARSGNPTIGLKVLIKLYKISLNHIYLENQRFSGLKII